MSKYVKYWPFIFILIQCTHSESDTSNGAEGSEDQINIVSNSYASLYTVYNINYSYLEKSQIHDYSDNWDLDGDGILDRVMFVGNGGAHLIYRLLIYISSTDDFIFYPYLCTDMPVYSPSDSLISNVNATPSFVVYDFNDDGKDDIYFKLINDNYIPDTLKQMGIETTKLILNYNEKDRSFDINNY